MKLRLRKNNIIEDKNQKNVLGIFLGFSRGPLIKRRRLSYRLSNPVVWELQKNGTCIIQNQNTSFFYLHQLTKNFPDIKKLLLLNTGIKNLNARRNLSVHQPF